MHWKLARKPLLELVQQLARVIDNKQVMPVYANIEFAFQEGRILLRASSTELEAQGAIPYADDDYSKELAGVITTVPAQKLLNGCQVISDDVIGFEYTENHIQLNFNGGHFLLNTNNNTLPHMGGGDLDAGENKLSLTHKELRGLLDATHFAIGVNDPRPSLKGLLLELSEEGITAVATDGYRLSIAKLDRPQAVEGKAMSQAIVPNKTIKELRDLLRGDDEVIEMVFFGEDHFGFSVQHPTPLKVMSTLINSTFPPYRMVVPKEKLGTLTVQREVLIDNLARVVAISKKIPRVVVLHVNSNHMIIRSASEEGEESEVSIPCAYDSDPIQLGFNEAFFKDILQLMTDKEVTFTLGEKNSLTIHYTHRQGRTHTNADPADDAQATHDAAVTIQYIMVPLTL